MTYEELRKAEELKKDIENLKECVDYFSPVTNGKYFSFGKLSLSAERTLTTNKFRFVFNYKKKTTRQQIVNCTYKVMEEETQYGLIRNLLTIYCPNCGAKMDGKGD